MRRVVVAFVVILLVLPFVYAQSYPPCQSNSDCSQGYYCIGNQCREPCTSNADCDEGTCQQDGYCGTTVCGNNLVEGSEECDGTSDLNCPGQCSPVCTCPSQPVCGDNVLTSPPEECDDGNNIDGDGCSAICLSEKEIHYVLYDLAINHNLLFSKVQDLLHIVNDLLFQLEIKTIEIQLTDFPCNQQPVSFWIPADLSPYGKLNEIDALVKLLIKAIKDGGETNFGLSTQDLINSQSKLADAECLISSNQFRNAFNCKCLAYKDLLGVVDASVVCSDCAE